MDANTLIKVYQSKIEDELLTKQIKEQTEKTIKLKTNFASLQLEQWKRKIGLSTTMQSRIIPNMPSIYINRQ